MEVYAYKMTNDSGFAPNPFFGKLTLATCKPGIRQSKKIGDYIAGFTSKELCGEKCLNRLIFLAKISDIIPHFDYFNHPEFQEKIPKNNKEFIYRAGDNIYKPLVDNPKSWKDFETIENFNHDDTQKEHDLSGINVLISEEFWYFGRNALKIAPELQINIPEKQTRYGEKTEGERFKKFLKALKEKFGKHGIYGKPFKWPESDNSWKYDINFVIDLSNATNSLP